MDDAEIKLNPSLQHKVLYSKIKQLNKNKHNHIKIVPLSTSPPNPFTHPTSLTDGLMMNTGEQSEHRTAWLVETLIVGTSSSGDSCIANKVQHRRRIAQGLGGDADPHLEQQLTQRQRIQPRKHWKHR